MTSCGRRRMPKLLTIPNRTLRLESKPIEKITSKVKAIAETLIEMMGETYNGLMAIGIAAPQIGKLVRMFVYRPNPYSDAPDYVVVINPELVYAKGKVILNESCLSIPGRVFKVQRHKIVKLSGLNLDGEQRTFKGRGLTAQELEHELNHLDGILIDEIGRTD